MEILHDKTKFPEDKLRMFLIFYLSIDSITNNDMVEYEFALKNAECDISALKYIKQFRKFSQIGTINNAPVQQNDFMGLLFLIFR